MTPVTPCLRPGCGHEAAARGLCRWDYQAALVLIRNGQTTWEDLIRRGKALATHAQGPQHRVDADAARHWFLLPGLPDGQ